MSYIITDDKHYKNIAKSIRSKMQTDREYYPEYMAIAIDNIPSSADGTDNPVISIYYINPDENGHPTKVKISGWINPGGNFPNVFNYNNNNLYLKEVEFINCNFALLADNAFNGCLSLATINLPDSLTSIGSYTFNRCLFTTINLPDSLTSIGAYAFSNCSLTTIILPSNLISIGSNAFQSCDRLTTIHIPGNVTSIGDNLFLYCGSLKEVTICDNFNLNNLNLSSSTKYIRETILQWLNALADRTGQTAYKLIIGSKNLKKLTQEDIAIATVKNWTLA